MIKIFRKIRQISIEKKNITNYLKYAIGEIVLVVIGILIAIQINNLNEERKLNLELEELKTSLISDLNKDVISISEELDLLINDTAKLGNYFTRMSDPGVTVDTLIQIYSSEFTPTIYGAIYFNNNTINSLKSTGNFSHLEAWLQQSLVEIGELKENYLSTKNDIVNYVDLLVLNPHQFPRNEGGIKRNSRLSNAIWKTTNFAELGSFMNSLFGAKKVIESEAIEQLKEIKIKTNEILHKLNTKNVQ